MHGEAGARRSSCREGGEEAGERAIRDGISCSVQRMQGCAAVLSMFQLVALVVVGRTAEGGRGRKRSQELQGTDECKSKRLETLLDGLLLSSCVHFCLRRVPGLVR